MEFDNKLLSPSKNYNQQSSFCIRSVAYCLLRDLCRPLATRGQNPDLSQWKPLLSPGTFVTSCFSFNSCKFLKSFPSLSPLHTCSSPVWNSSIAHFIFCIMHCTFSPSFLKASPLSKVLLFILFHTKGNFFSSVVVVLDYR